MVRLHPDPPLAITPTHGAIAQLGERLLCKQEVTGSIPVGSTSKRRDAKEKRRERNQQSMARCDVDWCVFFRTKCCRLLFNNLGLEGSCSRERARCDDAFE